MNSEMKNITFAQNRGGISSLSDENISNSIYFIRFIAILAVIAAHVNVVDTNSIFSNVVTHIWAIIARFGVPAFLITGGYYYHREKGDTKEYWKKKLLSVIIPWVIASAITYAVTIVFGTPFSIFGYFKWFIGSASFYYYMTIYLIMLIIFKFINNKTGLLIASIVVTFISLYLEQIGLYGEYGNTIMTSYLNPLNWIGFFAFGILIRKYHLEIKINDKVIALSGIIYILFAIIECWLEKLSYFSIFNPITQTALIIMLFGIFSLHYSKKPHRITLFIATNTLIIYLYHIQIVQFVLNRLPSIWIVELMKPVFGLMIMTIIIFGGYLILSYIPYGKSIMKLIGLKEPKLRRIQ